MTKIIIDLDDPKLHKAAGKISAAIRERFPGAQIKIEENFDPPKLYVIAVVDIDDIEPVMDSYMDLLLDYQVEDRLPLDVIISRTPERQKADFDLACEQFKLRQLRPEAIET